MIDEEFENRWQILMDHREKIFNINSYIDDGFEKVCDVATLGAEWKYRNINKSLMFSEHTSWVYFIVQGENIVKCGETGNPLGIREVYNYGGETQPVGSSKCRFGRLRRGDGTDNYIRQELNEGIRAGINVSLWAKKCQLHVVNERIGGVKCKVDTSIHKHLEQMYLAYFKQETGRFPLLNKASK
jgi:hypothetical protein